MAQADPMSGMIPEIISSSAPKHAAEIFKAPHRLGVRVIGEDRAEQEPARCTLATVMAGSLPPAMKWHPALMLTCPRCRRH